MLVIGAALAAVTLSGCASQDRSSPTPVPSDSRSSGAPLPVESWVGSTAGNPHLDLAADGSFTGSDGCNGFSGTYTRDGDAITVTRLLGGMKACSGVDMWLSKAYTAKKDGSTLTVFDRLGERIGTLDAR